MPVPLDEFPIHQTPLSLEHVATGDRNFYDRCYLAAFAKDGETILLSGFGVYPNLGVKDAYATVRTGDRQWSVRFSDAMDTNRLDQRVGDYRIEVVKPLEELRLVCDGDDLGLGVDLTWRGSFPAVQEAHHIVRNHGRTTIDASRLAQLGSWEGTLRFDGKEVAVTPDAWVGARDRSWGIRGVGEPEPPGRYAGAFAGHWWTYIQLRFDDFAIVMMGQEEPSGHRTQNDAIRVWGDGRIEQLGWPEYDIRYRSGTRHPEHVTIHLRSRGTPVTLEIDPRIAISLPIGAGYGGATDWKHGQWMGEAWSEGVEFDHTDPALQARFFMGNVDHSARATCDGQEGWGLFEHLTIGRHDPTGFTDFTSVAP